MLRELAKLKCYVAHLEREGLQELKLAMVGTPASQSVDLISARVHKAGKLAPPSSGAPSPSVESWQAPSPLGPAPESLMHLHHYNVSGPKGGGGDSTGGVPSHESLCGHWWPLRKLSASGGTTGGPSIPCHIPQIIHPDGSFMWVNLKGCSKMYICEQCEKQTSNQDSMVSHCL